MLEGFSSGKFEYKRIPLEEQEKRQILGRLAGVIADTKSPTRNGRKYSKDLWEKVFNDPIMKEKIANRCVFAELGHPADREEVDMEKVCACLAEQPKIGDDGKIYGVFDILNTANGRILKTLCDYGTNIGVSSRGTGDLYTDENGEEAVDPETYNCECWDIVVVPAVESARLKYVTEALDSKRYNKTLKQKLNEQLENATNEERKIMKESLNTLLDIDEAAYTRDELLDKFGTDDLDIINAGNEEDVTLADDYLSAEDEDALVNSMRKMNGKEPIDMGSDLVPNDAEVVTDPQPTETEGLNEAKHQYIGMDDVDFDTCPALYNALDCNGISLIKYDNDVLVPERVDLATLEENGIDFKDVKKDIDTLAYSMSVASGVDDDAFAESLDEKLVEVPEDEQAAVEDQLKAMGWQIEGKGRTFMGSVHYQLFMEFDHEVTRDDARPVVEALNELSEEMRAREIPMTYNVGLHVRGANILSCGLDLHKKYVEESIDEAMPVEAGAQREFIGKLMRLKSQIDYILKYDQDNDFNNEADPVVKQNIEDALNAIQKLSSELSVNEELEDTATDADYYQGQLDKLYSDVETLYREMSDDQELEGSYTLKNIKKIFDLLDSQGQLMNEAKERGVKKFDNAEDAREYIMSLPDDVEPRMDAFEEENEDGSITTWYEVYAWEDKDESISENCDDKELEECGPVDNVMVNQTEELTEALLKVKELEKDNLSLQEKLSVCNAKEVQLGEELKKYKASTASLSESAKQAKALTESVKTYTKELNEKDQIIESLKKDASLVEGLNDRVQQLEEELNRKSAEVSKVNETLNRYRSSLKSTRELYLEALSNAYGLDINEVRSRLTESYKNKDIQRVCDDLLEEKRNLSKLPFALTENVRVQAKSNKKDVQKGKAYSFYDDDNTESLLNLINF